MVSDNSCFNSMAISCSSTVNYNSTLQSPSTFLTFCKVCPLRSSFSLRPKTKIRHLKSLSKINATATLESGNGSVSLSSEGSSGIGSLSTNYGRIYFPLAAVVGQVSLFLHLYSPMHNVRIRYE